MSDGHGSPCAECGKLTTPGGGEATTAGSLVDGSWEWYMLHDDVWESIIKPGERWLCIGCVERRLGRRLDPDDFPNYAINDWDSRLNTERLRYRLGHSVGGRKVRV